MHAINTVRAACFLAGVLCKQKQDPLCGNCKAWVNSVTAVRELLFRLEAGQADELAGLPSGIAALHADAKMLVAGLLLPAGAAGQKKAGNCLLPPGLCFVKSSKALLEKL